MSAISSNSSYNNYSMNDVQNQEATLNSSNDDSTVTLQDANADSAMASATPELYRKTNMAGASSELYRKTNGGVSNDSVADKMAPAVDSSTITAKTSNISLQYENNDGSTTAVTIGKDRVTFTDSSNASAEPVKQVIKYADIPTMSAQQQAKMEQLSGALSTTEGSSIGGREGRLLENAKARIETLQNPNFFEQVSERLASDDFKTVDLFNGDRVIVTEEYDLTASGKGLFSVFNPGDGYTTRGIKLAEDGTAATFGKKKGDKSPIYTDENGQLKVVLGHEKVTDEQMQDKAITEVMTEQVKGSGIHALPVEIIDGQSSLHNLGAGAIDGQIVFGYDRSDGAMDQVSVGNNAIKITTTVPGATAGDNSTVEFHVKYADMNNWSSTDYSMVGDVSTALQNADTSLMTDAQQTLHKQALAKLDALQDPMFWNSVNTKVAAQVNGEVNGKPAVIKEEFRLIETTKLSGGGTEKEFFVDRGKGREKVEINDDDTVTLDGKKLPARLDEQSGDWYVVTDHTSAEQLIGQITAQHMKVYGDQAAAGELTPLSAMAQLPNPMIYQADSSEPNNAKPSTP